MVLQRGRAMYAVVPSCTLFFSNRLAIADAVLENRRFISGEMSIVVTCLAPDGMTCQHLSPFTCTCMPYVMYLLKHLQADLCVRIGKTQQVTEYTSLSYLMFMT